MGALTLGIFDRGDGHYAHGYGAMIRKGNLSRNFAEGNSVGERWYGLYRRRLEPGRCSVVVAAMSVVPFVVLLSLSLSLGWLEMQLESSGLGG